MSSLSSKTISADFDSLAASALSDRGNVRPALLAALTDLFVSRETPDGKEIARFEDMALRLIGDADPATRAHVAARLARHRFAPVSVLDALLHADRACATILIEHCERVPEDILFAIVAAGTLDELQVLARRHKLDPVIASLLSQRPEPEVLCALTENSGVEIDSAMRANLIARARESDALARVLCKRLRDSRDLGPLFLHASPEQRAEILRDAEYANFTGAQLKRVEIASDILIDWIAERGRQGLWSLVAQEIVRLTGFPRTVVDRLLVDGRGDGLAILLAAIGFPAAKSIRLFLACPPSISHSYERVKALGHIVEHMPAHAAHKIVHEIAGTGVEAPRRKHVPMYDPLAASTPGRARTGLSSHQSPAPAAARGGLRAQR